MQNNTESYYFAYGSNMNQDRMKVRDCQFETRQKGILPDYKFDFSKQSQEKGKSFANVREQKGSIVQGALYKLKGESEILKMDVFESYPTNYTRKQLKIYTDESLKNFTLAWVYIATPEFTVDNHKPNKEYLSHILCGKDLVTPEYFQMINNSETID